MAFALAPYSMLEPPMSAYAPYMGGGDVLVRISPTQTIALDNHILATYLPGIVRSAIRTGGYHGTYNLLPFLHRCPAVRQRLISPRVLRRTFALLLDSLARNIGSSETPNVDLMTFLESEFIRDQQYHRRSGTFGSFGVYRAFPRTFNRFVAISSIASAFHSKRIRSVLTQFFMKVGAEIARLENPYSLLLWAFAVLNADLLETDIISCLREIIVGRPTFVAEVGRLAMAERDPNAALLWENLKEIMERMGAADTPYGLGTGLDRGRGLLRRGASMRGYSYSPLMSAGYGGLGRIPLGALMRRGRYGRGLMRGIGYPARSGTGALLRRQGNQEYRLSRLERKVDAVEDVVEGGGYMSDGFVGDSTYLGDGVVYETDIWNDPMMSEMEYDPAFMDV